MFKTKLFAAICSVSSVVVAASTAVALAVSGPRETQSLRLLSDNTAVAYGITNIFDTDSSIAEIVNTVSENKTAMKAGFVINSIEGIDEVSGFGAGLELDIDTENSEGSLILDASYGGMELLAATLYYNSDELVGYMPALFEGIITAPLNNLPEDFEGSYIYELMAEEGFDLDEFRSELDSAISQVSANMSQFDFDYEGFAEGLCDTVREAYYDAAESMNVTDMGKVTLNSGDAYQCYYVDVPVADLSYILKDAVLYILESDELAEYIDQVYAYMAEADSDYSYYADMDMASQLQSAATMVDAYWGQIVTEIENVLGKNITFTIYLTDAVETAGFEFYLHVDSNGSVSYDKADAANAAFSVSIMADYTGGENIGDYTSIALNCMEYGSTEAIMNYSHALEENGDFVLNALFNDTYSTSEITADGSYIEDGQFFDLQVDSLKIIEDGETLCDIGLTLSCTPIDAIQRPSATPEYNIWEMDEADFEALGDEASDKIETLLNLIQ